MVNSDDKNVCLTAIWNFLHRLKFQIPTVWGLTSIIKNYSGNPLQKTSVSLHRHTTIWPVITASIDLRISGITRSSFSSRSIESCEISNNIDQLFGTFESFLWWKIFNCLRRKTNFRIFWDNQILSIEFSSNPSLIVIKNHISESFGRSEALSILTGKRRISQYRVRGDDRGVKGVQPFLGCSTGIALKKVQFR